MQPSPVRYSSISQIPDSPGEPSRVDEAPQLPRRIPFHPPDPVEAAEQVRIAHKAGLRLLHLLNIPAHRQLPAAPPFYGDQPQQWRWQLYSQAWDAMWALLLRRSLSFPIRGFWSPCNPRIIGYAVADVNKAMDWMSCCTSSNNKFAWYPHMYDHLFIVMVFFHPRVPPDLGVFCDMGNLLSEWVSPSIVMYISCALKRYT